MNKIKIAAAIITLLCIAAFAQEKGTFTDPRDKKKYKTVKIGGFTWMAENLSFNAKGSQCPGEEKRITPCWGGKPGDKPGKCVDIECTDWAEDGDFNSWCTKYKKLPAKQIQDLDKELKATCAISGRRYDAETASKACPAGWHLPSYKAWDILLEMAGGIRSNPGKKLTATSAGGTDELGFAALPDNSHWWFFNKDGGYSDFKIEGEGVYGNRGNEDKFVRCAQGKSTDDVLAAIAAAEKAEVEKAVGKQFNPKIIYGSMTDARDKITYKTAKIGEQNWLAENLNYNANGSKCFKDKDYICKRDGRLYDWATAKTACPAGWHLPTDGEWDALMKTVGGDHEASGAKLKAAKGWSGDGNGTDEFGFSALPAGSGEGNSYYSNGAWWWSASEMSGSGIYRNIALPEKNKDGFIRSRTAKSFLYSVRCLEGEAPKEAPAAAQPAQKPASQPQPPPANANENCSITFPKKSCVSMPAGSCKMAGGKVVDK